VRYILVLLFLCSLLSAQIPEGYYDGTEGLTGEELKEALHNIIKDHVCFSYASLWDILKDTDRDPDNPDNVILIYTGWSVDAAQEYNEGNGWNREHVWAVSHGNLGTGMGAGTDVHHIRPCDISVNSARGNKDFDNGGVEYIDPDGPTGCYTTTYTWEPRDEDKGDVARMIFYMVVRYEGVGGPDLEMVDYAPSAPNNEPFHGVFSTLYEWHLADPPDDREIYRNDVIYHNYQQNRNPFIDHPEFATLIWFPSSNNDDIVDISPIYYLSQNYPNPFNPSTTIDFRIKDGDSGFFEIFNLKGQLILLEEFKSGKHSINWDADGYPSGIYFYSLRSPSTRQTRKMILLK